MSNDKRKSDRDPHDRAIGKKHQSTGWIKKISIVFLSCVLALTLATPMLHAEDLQIGPAIGGGAVARAAVPAPTIKKVFYDATTISGGGVHRGKLDGKTARGTVHVTLKDKNGNEKATASVTPTSGTSWTVKLTEGVTVAAGDTVTAYQTFGQDTSPVATANAEPSMAFLNKDKIKMPSGEIWIEHPDANLVNKDEQAEATEMLKSANSDIANDFEKVVFSIDGTEHAYYEVTYTDESTSGKIEAPDLKIKQVKEKSAAPTIEKVQVTDGHIIVTLDKEVAEGTKFYFVKNFTDGEDKNFCEGGDCKLDKSNSQEMSQAVSVDGKKVTFTINDDDLELGRTFGIVVKEPHKFRSCAKSEPVPTTPAKVAVRDPRKLTDDDKKAIDKAIRDANTVNGNSKLPNLLQGQPYPAIIEFDKDGNVTIISPNDVEISDWDSNYNPVFGKNPDGTYKVKDGAKVTKFPAKDLVKNIAPKSPVIAVDTDTGKVTITPPAYKDPGDDTDLAFYTVTYKDASGVEKTVTATRTVDEASGKTTWTADNATVDANTGVITLKVEDIELAGTVKAIAKDNGGLIPEETPLDSDPETQTLETATVSYDANGGKGTMTDEKLKDGKTLNKGAKYKILDNKFTAPVNEKFKTWKIGETEYAAGAEITVKEDTSIKAIWQKTHSVTYAWGTDVPAGKDLPKDNGSYCAGEKYTLDTTYKKGDTVEGTKDGKKGTWTFSGWTDPNNGTMGDEDVTIKGSWNFTEANKYQVIYAWGADAPDTVTLPTDSKNYYKGDSYTLDTNYKANDTVEGKQGDKKGTWIFNGWNDPNNGTMGEGNVTITGSWSFTEAAKYKVNYAWGTDAPDTAVLPTDSKDYYKGDSYKLDTTYKANDTVEGKQGDKKGTWTFNGWNDPNNGTMGEQEVTITGSWTFTEAEKYKVSYDWGTDAPGTETKPEDKSYYKGETYTVDGKYTNGTTVEGKQGDKKGAWTFNGWDKTGELAVDENTVIKGSWSFTEATKYKVIYDWGADAPAGKDLPEDNGSYYAGDTYTVDDKYTNATTVSGRKGGKKGTWTFSGWTDPNNGTMGDGNVTITGTWTFKKTPDNPGTVTPDNPKKPGTDTSDNPNNPDNPNTPGNPNTPDNPGTNTPNDPNKPGTPDNPNNPGTTTPGTSDKPGTTTPGTSDKSGTTTPGTTKTPETSTPSQKEGKANMTKPGKTAPKTGDASVLSLCASGILAAGGAVALLKKRREER
ncbi:SHIRT domain-containing protein [Murdochiella sp. Marseille-P8839]|nr:SHIRT domain-containing protein [Murdochiella sp. Marseille-P8839]